MFELLIMACTLTNDHQVMCETPITAQYTTYSECNITGPLIIDDMVTAGWIERGFAMIEYTCKKI